MSRYGRRGYSDFYGYGGWAPYVPVAQRRANAAKFAQELAKKENRRLAPVAISGRKMATTYWGRAWCDNLEAYSDFANRLPRGRTYARNGSVVDLQIAKGNIKAIVSGSEVYTVSISIAALAAKSWARLKAECSRSIASLIDLLQGRFDVGVMERLAHRQDGLFPQPQEIKMTCSCPDWAGLCKHVAAVLYGVGNRLDASPELLFVLRNVDHLELVSDAVADGNLDSTLGAQGSDALSGSDLGEMFGIELDASQAAPKKTRRAKKAVAASAKPAAASAEPTAAATRKAAGKRPAKKKPAAAKSAKKKPAAAKSAKKKPVAAKPAKKKPVAAKPAKKTPVAAKSAKRKPAAAKRAAGSGRKRAKAG